MSGTRLDKGVALDRFAEASGTEPARRTAIAWFLPVTLRS